MKKFIKCFSISVVAIIGLLQFSGCSKSNGPSAQETMRSALSATWLLQSVLVDGVDNTSVYQGLTLQFGPGTYATTNGKVVWPASGTWKFVSADGKTIQRDDNLMITIVEITKTSLKMSFVWNGTTLGSGRELAVGGQNVFSFTKQ